MRLLVSVLLLLAPAVFSHATDWPMLGRTAARAGTTPDEIRPPFERKWYRLFSGEGIMAGVQPIVFEGKVFLGTLRGVLHAMDAGTGANLWTFQAGGAVLHSCAAAEGRVFFGNADGNIYAVDAQKGTLAWTVQTGAAVWNAPLVHDATVYVGSRDAKLYAITAATGKIRWTAITGGPLLNSPALDPAREVVYVGSEDMRVYAFRIRDGAELWKSEKLPGVSLRGYHPVIAPDGAVMVTAQPAPTLDRIGQVLLDMVKDVFGDFANWRHTRDENEKLRARNFELMREPETYVRQLDYLRQRLVREPALQTFFVLDPRTGEKRFVTPIVYAESMNGPGGPPIVTSEGRVIVKYQALLRSRYEHYSPFLNVGFLNTTNGHIDPIMDQARTYGWHDSLLLVHDEQSQLVAGGRVLINTHQDNVNALNLETLRGDGEPWARNIHEPTEGEALAIWSRILANEPLPEGKEWLARGTAVYGGGSVIDVPITIAADSFYFLPTHELNSGCVLIAYRKDPDPRPARAARLAEPLSGPQQAQVRSLPWDWDTLTMPRLNHVLKALPDHPSGTRARPLTNEAATAALKITDDEIDQFIRVEPAWFRAITITRIRDRETLLTRLGEATAELISAQWRPLLFPSGKHPEEAYRFFNDPTETLYTLAVAYPFLESTLQTKTRQRVADLMKLGGPLASATGIRVYDSKAGLVRSAYDHPPENLMRTSEGSIRSEVARIYPFWLWARVTGDWALLESRRDSFAALVESAPGRIEEDCHNGYVSGLIAFCRIAKHFGDDAALARALPVARRAIRDRIAYELAFTRGGLIHPVPTGRSIYSRWNHLTPDVAAICARYAASTQRELMRVYVDHHRPTWWLAWNVETLWRNESPMELPTASAQVFAARALILKEPAITLARYLDLPWCRADEYYIQKLALTLAADHIE